MSGAMQSEEARVSDRQIAAILAGVERLESLPEVATRLLSMGSDEDVRLDEVIELIESDPALSARMLALCKSSEKGLGDRITSVRRAVIMLGLDTVRCAVLSVLVCGRIGAREGELGSVFDIGGYWTRSIGVACVSERIARAHPSIGVAPEQAHLAGLLSGLGKLAMHNVLPRAWEKALTLARSRGVTLASAERAAIGIDHHTLGKRLAEHWGLPGWVRDVIWLYGQDGTLVPEHAPRALVQLVSLADLWCESTHLGWSGDGRVELSVERAGAALGITPEDLGGMLERVVDRVSERARILGVGEASGTELLVDSLSRANGRLADLNDALRARQIVAERSHRLLGVADAFLGGVEDDSDPERVCAAMVSCVSAITGCDHGYVVLQRGAHERWELLTIEGGRVRGEARMLRALEIGGREGAVRPAEIATMSGDHAMELAGVGWFGELILGAREMGAPALVGVGDGPGASALVVLIKCGGRASEELTSKAMRGVRRMWARTLESSVRLEANGSLVEDLASANRTLQDLQRERARDESLLRLGQMAAGAAHEMNNPLTVILGRAQYLFERLGTARDREAARAIAESADRLASMITSMHLLAEPPRPAIAPVDPVLVVRQAVEQAKERCLRAGVRARVKIEIKGTLAPVEVDRDLLSQAICEPVMNGVQANPGGVVQVSIEHDDADGRVMIRITDSGPGLSHRALNHAFDPFFSEQDAGRRPGLGLARARSIIELHGGVIEIGNRIGAPGGAQVEIGLKSKGRGVRSAA